jgi:phage terminase small subunit
MNGRKPSITALPGALDKPPPAPAWLPKFAKAEWARVVPAMVRSRSLAAHELSTVESYCIAVARIRECEKKTRLASRYRPADRLEGLAHGAATGNPCRSLPATARALREESTEGNAKGSVKWQLFAGNFQLI